MAWFAIRLCPQKGEIGDISHDSFNLSLSIYIILGFSHAIRVSLLGERPDGPWESHHKKHPKSGGEQQHPKAPNAALSHVSKLNITGQLDL
jgi:hypothetical protein